MKINKINFIKKNCLTLSKKSSLFDAIRKIDKLNSKTVVIKDKKDKFLGTITDGDIRRLLIKGYSLETKIINILKKKYITSSDQSSDKEIYDIMKKHTINCVPILDKKKVVQDIRYLSQFHNKAFKNLFIIMAGGKGTRLLPLTKKIPKPMIKIQEKPVLEHIILNAKKEGFENIVLSINYLGKLIKKYFQNGKKFGVNISYLTESKPLGTCGSLSLIRKKLVKPIIVCNGDLISNIKFSELLNFHNRNKADITVVTKPYETKNPFGVVKLNNNRIVDIEEKPSIKSNIIVGTYVLSNKLLKFLRKNKKIDMTDFLKNLSKKNKKILTFPLYESWTDIGNLKDLINARKKN